MAAIQRIYQTPLDPGSLGGIKRLHLSLKKQGISASRSKVLKTLKGDDVYTLHKPTRRRFRRNPTIVGGIDKQWQADLVDMTRLSRKNSGYNYILMVIDCFSRFAWALPIKKKDGKTMVTAFKLLLEQSAPRQPQRLHTDKGKEFLNKPFQDFLKEKGISHFTTENETKASQVERLNRTIKSRMFRHFTATQSERFVEVLPDLIHSYNHSHHRSIGMSPADVTGNDEKRIWKEAYLSKMNVGTSSRLRVGQYVRVNTSKSVFEKGYRAGWSEEIFRVSGITGYPIQVYKLEDLNGQPVRGTFYTQELEAIEYKPPTRFIIEKILRKRRLRGITELLIKWKDYPIRLATWITEDQLRQYESV